MMFPVGTEVPREKPVPVPLFHHRSHMDFPGFVSGLL